MTTSKPESYKHPSSLNILLLRILKITVGVVACIEVIIFSFNMSLVVRRFAAPLPRPLNNWFLLYLVALVALYMGLPIACAMLVAKNKSFRREEPSGPLFWIFIIVPVRILTLTLLALQLDAFHYVMGPQLASIIAISAFYAFAYSTKQKMLKLDLPVDGREFNGNGASKFMVVNDVGLPPPILIAELQVVDLKGLKEQAVKRKKSSI